MARAKNFNESRLFAGFQTMAKNRCFYPALLAIVTFVVFWKVIGYEFVLYDDDFTVYKNPYLQSVSVSSMMGFWKNPYEDAYMPFSLTILAVEALFAKTAPTGLYKIEFNPAVFHASNLIFHIMNVLLVFLILRILLKDESACFIGALLYAIHPVQVEPVAWVTGVKDVFSGFLSLLSIWQYLLYSKSSISPEGGEGGKKRKALHYIAAVFSFLLAILAKPTRVIVPIAAFIIDYFIVKRRLRDIVVSLIGFIAIAVPIIVLTIYLMPSVDKAAPGLSLLERLLIASDSLVFYLYKLIVPISLGPDYGRTPKLVLSQTFTYIAWIIPVIVLILIYIMHRHRSFLLASAGIFIAGALPVLGLIQFKFQGISTVADRYLYLSMLGPGLALAYFLSRNALSLNRKRLVMGMCGAVLCVLGILSMMQTRYWGNTITLYRHALKINPDSSTFQANLGIILAEQEKYDEAAAHFSEALRIKPDHVKAHVYLGYILAQQGNVDDAVFHFNEALRFSPDDVEAHTNMGIVLAQRGKLDDAVFHFREALRISPGDAGAHTNLGIILALQGKHDEANLHFNEALKINPDAYNDIIKARSLKK